MNTIKLALSGAQGAGKSTILKAFQGSVLPKAINDCLGGEMEMLPEIVRSLRARGFLINDHATPDTEIAVQTTHMNNLLLKNSFITDRCLVDNYLYARLANRVSKQWLDYTEWLLENYLLRYDRIYYLPSEFQPPEDGVRKLDIGFYEASKKMFEEFYSAFMKRNDHNIIILTGSVDDRMRVIEKDVQMILANKLRDSGGV